MTERAPGGRKYNEFIGEGRTRIRRVELRLQKLREEIRLENHQLDRFVAIGEDLRLLRDVLYQLEKIGDAAAKERTGKD